MVWITVTSLIAATIAASMLFGEEGRKPLMTWRTFALVTGPLLVVALIADLALGGGFDRPTGVAWVLIAVSTAYVPYGVVLQRRTTDKVLRHQVRAFFDGDGTTMTREEAPVVTRELPAVLWIFDGFLAFGGLLGLVASALPS